MGKHAARRQTDDNAELPVGRLLFPLSVVRSSPEDSRSAGTRMLTADTDLDVLMHALIGDQARSAPVAGRAESTCQVEAQLADVLRSVGLSDPRSAQAVESAPGDHHRGEAGAGAGPAGNDSSERVVRGWLRLLVRSDDTERDTPRRSTDHAALTPRDDVRRHDEPSDRGQAVAPRQSSVRRPFVASRLTQWVCGLRGHDEMLSFDSGRLFLRCTSCGHESPGWTPGERRLIVKWHTARRPANVAQFPEAGRVWILPHHAPVASSRKRA